MPTFLTKIKALTQKPLVQKIAGPLLADAIPRVKAKIGEDPIVAFGGLATFLTWLAGKLPAKIATPVQFVVGALSLIGAKATVTPIANPKVIVTVPIAIEPAKPVSGQGFGEAQLAAKPSAPAAKPPAAPKVKVTVPLVPARNALQDAVAGAVAKLKGA